MLLPVLFLLGACDGDDLEVSTPGPQPTVSATPSAQPTPAESPEPPTELRVAFLNLFSPLTLDADNPVAGDTFDERLEMVVKELKEFSPDVVGFNEASVTKAHGSAIAKLAKELKMEPQYARANPWLPGQLREQSDEAAKLFGFEEGELVLVRSDRFPILSAERLQLNPRTSESGEGRAALHVVLKGPGQMGTIDVYITHLTGGGDRIRRLQAADFTQQIVKTRSGAGPLVVMQGSDDPAGASTYDLYDAMGLREVGGKDAPPTCCRESVLGQQPALQARTDYLMAAGLEPSAVKVIAAKPLPRADGTLLYASDHNGIAAAFPITAMPPLP